MVFKSPIVPHRVRRVPRQFSWIDHRLVRDRHIERLSHPAAALYLFLITVGDAEGLSYYSDASVMKRLSMDASALSDARRNLIREGLIAFKRPLYQVLAMEALRPKMDQPLSLGDIFNRAKGGAS